MPRRAPVSPARLLLFFAALLASSAFLVSLGVSSAAAAKPCWEKVIDDWIDNGRIDASYSPACLRASLDHVPEDIRAYSDFEEKVKQAIQLSLRVQRIPQSSTGGNPELGREARRSQVERLEDEERTPPRQPDNDGPLRDALGYGTTDSSSIPLPLIILAALALILLSAGAAGVAHRKLAARRIRAK
jgi:hypothetical protein